MGETCEELSIFEVTKRTRGDKKEEMKWLRSNKRIEKRAYERCLETGVGKGATLGIFKMQNSAARNGDLVIKAGITCGRKKKFR